ncbi:hypothetical protein Aeqsu_0413 [Aequorivita sublithincola DSM 14238]|uniref:Uncharacterized protein n=1 Tax=Aequorivita sublithincola (strain DSM 14238 / LMG 21431 / ACAM 643 / 9-3) TaxID=746697 RepID=I3YSF8_AEQSU|nr:hypothetical protein [Aequorivita sublithincola]AFL79926.1 hypothetical protein Aeqsu_0413 [Aequorivita sublithincola DSM 14238]
MGTLKQLSLFCILIFSAFGLSSFTSKNLVVKILETDLMIEKQITVTITKNTTLEELEKIKKQMVDEGLQFNYSDVNYNENNEIISISIYYKDANNNSGNYSVSSKNPINDIAIISEGGRISVTSVGSSNQSFISQGSGVENSKNAEKSYEEHKQRMKERSDQMEMEMEERMQAMKERQAEMRNNMQQRRDSIRMLQQHQIKSATAFNGNSNLITKSSTDLELVELQKIYKAENISFSYNDLKRNDNNEITHISITIDNQNGSVSTSTFGNEEETIKNISIAVDKQHTIMRSVE